MKKATFLATALLAIIACKKDADTENTIESNPIEETRSVNSTPQKKCYLTVTESKENDKIVNDTILLNFERKGDSISGEFKWLPFYKDKKTGTFKGIVSNNTATTLLTAQAEGITNTEEFIFDIKPDRVLVKMGEMENNANGIWRYKNIQSTSDNTIEIAECR